MNAPTPQCNSVQYKVQGCIYLISVKLDSEYLVIVITKDQQIPNKKFEIKKTHQDCIKTLKLFTIFESVEDIANELSGLLQENKFKLKEQNDKILLYFSLYVTVRKKDDICFEIPQCEIKDHDIIMDICNTMNQIKVTLSLISERLTVLESNQLKPNTTQTIPLIDDTFLKTIKARISSNPFSFQLLYKATVHGDSAQSFHDYCDNINRTLIVVQTHRDIVIGGYTSVTWDQSNTWKKDDKAFIFSNTMKTIYPVKVGDEHAIHCCAGYAPLFGYGHDIAIFNNCLTSTQNGVCANSYPNGSKYELHNNEVYFQVKELEVYAVNFN